MKKVIRKYPALLPVLLLLISAVVSAGMPFVFAADGEENPDFNLFETAGVISEEFITGAIDLIQSNWEGNYFSSITMKLGEEEMLVDGSKIMLSNLAFSDNGKIMLPIIDIASAVKADLDIDEITGDITIVNDGEAIIIDSELPLAGNGFYSVPELENITSPDDCNLPLPVQEGCIMTKSPVFSASEIEEMLLLNIHSNGEDITISKPYQLKQIILYVKNGKQLNNNYGAGQYVTNDQGLYFLQYSSEKLTKAAYEAYKTDPGIAYVTLNQVVKTAALPDRWGSERIEADRFKTYLADNGKTTDSLVVAVLDTGVDVAHPHLQGRTVAGYNIINDNNNIYDAHSHGTHVAGTIVDCSTSNIKIMPVKVLGDDGSGDEFSSSLGIRYAADEGAEVINMSLGGECHDDNCLSKQAIDYAAAKGVVTVVAAGNDATDAKDHCPAHVAKAITVSAIHLDDSLAWFSNYGSDIDIAAPGVHICSSIPGGGYDYYSGTSMAAPHVAAAAAMLKLENPTATFEQLRQAVCATAVSKDPVSSFGAGILDFNVFFGEVPTEPPGIKLSRHSLNIDTIASKYQSYQIYARVTPVTATDKRVVYTSDNSEVAICDNDGRVRIMGKGTAIITATALGNGHTDSCAVTVTVDVSQFWLDWAADTFAGGEGTKENPYQIATPEQLALLARNARLRLPGGGQVFDEYFELIADIDLSGREWIAIGWTDGGSGASITRPFYGHFYGNGYVIKNMSQGSIFSGLGWAENGLFIMIGGEVRDLGVVDAEQKNVVAGDVGILAALAGGGKNVIIENCFTSGQTVGYGFIQQINGAYGGFPVIRNCYSTAKSDLNQFARYCSYTLICNCYAFGFSAFVNTVQQSSIITNSFCTNTQAGATRLILRKDNTTVNKCYVAADYYGNIIYDDDPSTTDISQRPLEFFKNINNYLDPANWSSENPWYFGNAWAIDQDYNDGLPYLRVFRSLPDQPQKVAAITANPLSGPVKEGTTVTLSTATEGAEIRYTTDGTNPTQSSPLYAEPIPITADTVIRAIASKPAREDSDLAIFVYKVAASYWTEWAAASFAQGTGSASNPYLIANAEQLAKLASDSLFNRATFTGQYFKLANDIDLGGRVWIPIGALADYPFRGNFDGAGFAVTNINIPDNNLPNGDICLSPGFFGFLSGGTVKNLALTDVNIITRNGSGGALAGYGNTVTISNCYTTGNASCSGFIYEAYKATISNCYSLADAKRVGLVFRCYDSLIHNSFAAGSIKGSPIESAAGISLFNTDARIINSFAANKALYGSGFLHSKNGGVVEKCYYLSANSTGLIADNNPGSTDLKAKELAFFQEKENFTNSLNWSSAYLWDFDSIWGFNENINGGFPYLRNFCDAKAPLLITQPEDKAVGEGRGATLSVSATVSKGMLSYQWYEVPDRINSGGMAIIGAKEASYDVPASEVGIKYYYCLVTNTDATVIGEKATSIATRAAAVTTMEAIAHPQTPLITVQPQDTTVSERALARLTIGASVSRGTLSYQWYENSNKTNSGGQLIAGATNTYYNAPTATLGTRHYYCVVTNTDPTATESQTTSLASNAVAVTVNVAVPPIVITTQPAAETFLIQGSISSSLSIEVTATAEPRYQWYSNTVNSNVGGTAISGASSDIFLIPPDLTAGTYYYYCMASIMGVGPSVTVRSDVAKVVVSDFSGGVSVSGKIKSYSPLNATTIQLIKDGMVYPTEIPAESGLGQAEQKFRFEGVAPGIYELIITKGAHTKFTVKNVIVGEGDLDLTLDSRPEVQLMTLRCGDINGDGLINDADLTILWRVGNYNKKTVEAENEWCDLNGDGLINDADLTILWLTYNYNRGSVVIE